MTSSSAAEFADPTGAASQRQPVSVVMPVLNEERHLAASVAGVLAQDHPMEIILAVGPSYDRTEQIAQELAAADPRIIVVPNPSGTTPDALNLAIAASHHDVIVRVDAHGELAPDYIHKAVELLERTGAANVGGLMAARGVTSFEKAVAVGYTSKVGLGGGSFHLASSKEGPADTVFLGVFRRDALQSVGGYDATLLRAQDWDLNYRLRKRGETVWFSPDLEVTYRPRSSVRALAKQFFKTGQWRREVMRRNPDTMSARYLAAPVTVLVMGVGSLAGVVGAVGGPKVLRWGFAAPACYLVSICGASALMRRQMEPAVRMRLPLVLGIMHLAWGAGALKGLPKDQREQATDPDQD